MHIWSYNYSLNVFFICLADITASVEAPAKRSSTKSQFKRPGLASVTVPR